jgi:hypothetical protein
MARQLTTRAIWCKPVIDGAGLRGYVAGVYCPVCSLENRYPLLQTRNEPHVKGGSTCDCPLDSDQLYSFTFNEQTAMQTVVGEVRA